MLSVGVLKQQGTEQCFPLGRHCLVGRHRHCNLRVDDKRISYRHAELRWRGDHWSLHDLGSRNGTFVGGRRLDAVEHVRIDKGQTFLIGSDLAFTLIDDGPPMLSARAKRTGGVRTAPSGMLLLPDDERPEVSVFEDPGGHWILEDTNTQRRVDDGEEIPAGGEIWTLSVPSQIQETVQNPMEDPLALENIALRIAVSRNQEHVEVSVIAGSRSTKLSSRVPYYLLLLLAQARIDDASDTPGERGWLDRDELCKKLRTTSHKLNVDVFRVREKFADLGVRGAPNIIERRPGDLRLGIDRVEVVDM